MCPTIKKKKIFSLDICSFTEQCFKSMRISAHGLYCASHVKSMAIGRWEKRSLNSTAQQVLAFGTPQPAITVMQSAPVHLLPNLVISSAILARASRPELRGPADQPVAGSFQFPHWQRSSFIHL